jgi:hypothetical protein
MSDKAAARSYFEGKDRVFESFMRRLSGGFSNLAGLDAVCANLHALSATLRKLNPN